MLLLTICTILEAFTGVACVIAPAPLSRLLFGAEVSGTGLAVSRVAGLALLSLGIACWPRDKTPGHSIGAFHAMLAYNGLITIYLFGLGLRGEWIGVLLWPAACGHAVLTILLARTFCRRQPFQKGTKQR
jgi:hypothetical protein